MPVAQPKWLRLFDRIALTLFQTGLKRLNPVAATNLDLAAIPYCALVHLIECLEASKYANLRGQHSVAISLVRQCIEALTIVDCGLQVQSFREPLLHAWKDDKKTQGELRQCLERNVWPRYGRGLWLETWTEFFGNLARAVQPYSHYSYPLMGWQFAFLDNDAEHTKLALFGVGTYDALKASRITLLHALTGWTLGRLLSENGEIHPSSELSNQLRQLGTALGNSKLLFKKKDWAVELMPDMFFKSGTDWREN